ncbi:type II secretion system protein N [Candidatus Electronema sp. TJ]|uniref:type II secretion system protein N n=1 Tax=Candidatus Electronema sp. TJ TaxID=3401573 RepID=UPI003AA7F739
MAKLAVIFALVAAGVHLSYRRLEEELREISCVPTKPADEAVAKQSAQAEAMPAPDAAAIEDFQVIVRRNIFQIKQAAAAQPEKPQEEKPQAQQQAAPTALNLALAGTVTGTDETARAIIIDNTSKKEQQILRVGDGVQGAIIKAIDWNSVTLDVNGRLELLKMPEIKPGALSQQVGGGRPFQPPPFLDAGSDAEATQGMRPVRPNRRVNLPQPGDEIPPEEGLHVDEPPPEPSEIVEEPQLPMPSEEELPLEPPPMD